MLENRVPVGTAIGTGDSWVCPEPSPTNPHELSPQQEGTPARRPQPPSRLTATCVQSEAVPTWTGSGWSAVEPVPRRPPRPSPQHHSVPVVLIAQLWSGLVATAAQSVAVPTWVGWTKLRSSTPSARCALSPQHHSAPSPSTAHAPVRLRPSERGVPAGPPSPGFPPSPPPSPVAPPGVTSSNPSRQPASTSPTATATARMRTT